MNTYETQILCVCCAFLGWCLTFFYYEIKYSDSLNNAKIGEYKNKIIEYKNKAEKERKLIIQLHELYRDIADMRKSSIGLVPFKITPRITDLFLSLPEDKRDCSICMDTIRDDLVVTNCSHLFHGECLACWNLQHKTCPDCRS